MRTFYATIDGKTFSKESNSHHKYKFAVLYKDPKIENLDVDFGWDIWSWHTKLTNIENIIKRPLKSYNQVIIVPVTTKPPQE